MTSGTGRHDFSHGRSRRINQILRILDKSNSSGGAAAVMSKQESDGLGNHHLRHLPFSSFEVTPDSRLQRKEVRLTIGKSKRSGLDSDILPYQSAADQNILDEQEDA